MVCLSKVPALLVRARVRARVWAQGALAVAKVWALGVAAVVKVWNSSSCSKSVFCRGRPACLDSLALFLVSWTAV